MARMWMVRGEGGTLYDSFRELGIVAVGWNQLAAHAKPGVTREQLIAIYKSADPFAKQGTAIASASQVWRFVNDINEGDWVITYSPFNRVYSIGKVAGPAKYLPEMTEQGMALARNVHWQSQELPRDNLSTHTKNSLGSTLTLFEVPQAAMSDVLSAQEVGSVTSKPKDEEVRDSIPDPLAEIETQALERIKDCVGELNWDDMQHLVAGILRAMGYKTQVSGKGADRGKDIVASPDGFGFEHPRIVVEVKHRDGQMGSKEIRGFLGGRHKDDRGLFVSTGGFSKEAQYEADRASIPLALWTLDHLVRALLEHYEATDAMTKRLVPLKRLYWLA